MPGRNDSDLVALLDDPLRTQAMRIGCRLRVVREPDPSVSKSLSLGDHRIDRSGPVAVGRVEMKDTSDRFGTDEKIGPGCRIGLIFPKEGMDRVEAERPIDLLFFEIEELGAAPRAQCSPCED